MPTNGEVFSTLRMVMTLLLIKLIMLYSSNIYVQTRIYEVNIQGAGLDIETDLSLVGINLSTVNHNPGNNVAFEVSTFYNSSYGELLALKNNTLYYIDKQQSLPPYLNDGQVENGFAIYGNLINQDFLVNATESNSFPYYTVLITEQQTLKVLIIMVFQEVQNQL